MTGAAVPPPVAANVGRFRHEPFRLLFPLGVLLGWIGVGHWILYAAGITATYSCLAHGLVQTQAFLLAFAAGFLMTAVPRRTSAPPPSRVELGAVAVALVVTTAAATAERWAVAEVAYATVFLVLLQFALRRFVGRAAGRRPPAAFVLIPMGALAGLAGAALLAASTVPSVPPAAMTLGRLLVEQGVFLCFAVGVGGLVLPLMGGAPPPADLGSAPAETRRALAYAVAGVGILGSLVLEPAFPRAAPLVRAATIAVGLGVGAGATRPPGRPGLHRRLVWIAVWLLPAGLVLSALLPDYRVPALHVLFIGGFGLLVFGVATHVSLAHVGLEEIGRGSPRAVVVLAVGIALALLARLAADWSDTYFAHLAWAAAAWIGGSGVWLAFLAPKLLRR